MGITIIIAGMTAIIEIDMKKINAFSKAILFMCAGIVIHNMKDYQDIRKIGISYNNINFCISIILVANIRLCGLPFLRGFYSKDLIIEILIIKGKNLFLFFFIM